VDVEDSQVDGGVFDRGTVGLNWWATRRWKIGVDYGLINLDRFGLTGRHPNGNRRRIRPCRARVHSSAIAWSATVHRRFVWRK
jgi:hypothetical protein